MRISSILSACLVLAVAAACTDATQPKPAAPNAVSAARDHGANDITACGTVISKRGTYTLANDIGPCPGDGIDVNAGNVVLELNGHTITGTRGHNPGSIGISAGIGVSGGVAHVDIQGPGTVTGFGAGVGFEQVTQSSMRQVTVDGNGQGFGFNRSFGTGDLIVSSHDVFEGNRFVNQQYHGVTMNGASNSLFVNNVSTNNGANGFYMYDASGIKLLNNTANGNGDRGIAAADGQQHVNEVIMHNTALGNGNLDMEDDNPNCDHDKWKNNKFATANQSCIH